MRVAGSVATGPGSLASSSPFDCSPLLPSAAAPRATGAPVVTPPPPTMSACACPLVRPAAVAVRTPAALLYCGPAFWPVCMVPEGLPPSDTFILPCWPQAGMRRAWSPLVATLARAPMPSPSASPAPTPAGRRPAPRPPPGPPMTQLWAPPPALPPPPTSARPASTISGPPSPAPRFAIPVG